jgi:hypothetical protein
MDHETRHYMSVKGPHDTDTESEYDVGAYGRRRGVPRRVGSPIEGITISPPKRRSFVDFDEDQLLVRDHIYT